MPTVETSVLINAPIDKVYAIAKDNLSFPEFMKDVLELKIVEQSGNRVVSDWVGLIPQFMKKVKWRQEDIWDDAAHLCTFKQLQGDYDKMEGTWRLTTEGSGTRFNSIVEYEYNSPTLGPLLKKVIFSIVTKNLDGVLAAIKARAED